MKNQNQQQDKAMSLLHCQMSEFEKLWNIRPNPGNAYYYEQIASGAAFFMIADAGGNIAAEQKRFIGTSKNWEAASQMFNGWVREHPFLFYIRNDEATLIAGYLPYNAESAKLSLAKTRLQLHSEGIIKLNEWELKQDNNLVNPPPPPPKMITIKESEHAALVTVAEAAKVCRQVLPQQTEHVSGDALNRLCESLDALASIRAQQ